VAGMRIKAEFWVKAYIRRLNGEAIPAAVLRHGDDDAGAIFIKINTRDGRAQILAPAPGADEGNMSGLDRRWSAAFPQGAVEEAQADGFLARQARFDADIWVIELEDPRGRHCLDDCLVAL
jgi:hypothetical protein